MSDQLTKISLESNGVRRGWGNSYEGYLPL